MRTGITTTLTRRNLLATTAGATAASLAMPGYLRAQGAAIKVGYAWSVSSQHPGGINTAFADGSVRFIKNAISPVTWFALQTIRNGEVVSADSF